MVVFLWLCLLLPSALAARLQLSVDSKQVAVGQTVSVDLQLVDGRYSGVPDLPVGRGLTATFRSQAQSTTIVNFERTRIIRYSYDVTATAVGEWQVGPIRMQVGGKTLEAPIAVIAVTERPKGEVAKAEASATLTDEAPFLGEVVVYRLQFRHKDEAFNMRWTPPSYDGFVEEQIAESVQGEGSVVDGGVRIHTLEILVPLVAAGAGDRTVSPALITADMPLPPDARTRRRSVDLFGRYRTRTERFGANALPVKVRPLPKAGKPAEFSGLVGSFVATAKVSAREAKVGDSLTMELTVAGTGTLAGFKLPHMPDGVGFRVYDDAPEISARITDGAFQSVARFRRAVVPEREGELTLPAVELAVFNPGTEAYEIVRTEPIRVRVKGGDGGGDVESFAGGAIDRRRDVEALGDDILPVPGAVSVGDRTLAAALPVVVGLPLVPALGLVGLWVSGAARNRRPDPWAVLRRRVAGLTEDPSGRLAELEDIFREAAGLRLGRPAPAVDRGSVAALGDEAAALYAALEAARYGGQAGDDLARRVLVFVEAGP